MKVYVLVENTTKSTLSCEHGLSFLIEFENHRILLDSGSSSLFMENAQKMQVSLENIDVCILSHGHYDHANGFTSFLEKYPKQKIVAMKNYDLEYYSGSNNHIHYIGVDPSLKTIYKKHFFCIENVYEIFPKVKLVPHFSSVVRKDKLYVKKGEEMILDDFQHELSLVFESKKGLIIFNSCSHGGVKNIIEEVRRVYAQTPIYAFIGGLHMKTKIQGKQASSYTKEEIEEILSLLKKEGCKYMYTGHCTGEVAMQRIKEVDASLLHSLYSGQSFEL